MRGNRRVVQKKSSVKTLSSGRKREDRHGKMFTLSLFFYDVRFSVLIPNFFLLLTCRKNFPGAEMPGRKVFPHRPDFVRNNTANGHPGSGTEIQKYFPR